MDYGLNLAQYTGRLWVALNRQLGVCLRHDGVPLTPEQFRVIRCLWEKDGCSQQELARLTTRDKAAIARIIDLLQDKGLVERVVDETDRRSNRVRLTDAGKALEAPAAQCARDTLDIALRGLSEQDIQAGMTMLKTALTNLTKK